MNRRKFLATLGGMGIAIPMAQNLAAAIDINRAQTFSSDLFEVTIDAENGAWELKRRNGEPVMAGITAQVTTSEGSHDIRDSKYRRELREEKVSDKLGSGRRIIIACTDSTKKLNLDYSITLYSGRPLVTFELTCSNPSTAGIKIPTAWPLRNIGDKGGFAFEPKKILTNGKMYYNAGHVLDPSDGQQAEAWWNTGFFRSYDSEGAVVGYIENRSSMGRIFSKRTGPNAVSLEARSDYEQEFTLAPGAVVSSDRVALLFGKDTLAALEDYAGAIGAIHAVSLLPPINGWCSWFYTFGTTTEDEMVRIAEFAGKHLKPYGMEYIQIDDGFYRGFGDWEGNSKFPHGMKWLAERIRQAGMRPGIWFAPYAISAGTEIYEKHPEWLIKNPDGSLKACGPNLRPDSPELKNPKPGICGLDISHPDAAKWLHNLFHTASKDWTYEFIKIDFVDWTLLSAETYYTPTATKASLYRRGAEIMREAAGPDCHILDCGPGNVSVGHFDSMRSELDQPPVTWNQYFLQPASSLPALGKRYYFHQKTWVNDFDHIVLAPFTIAQAQAVASIAGLSGGNTLSGDRLTDLDAMRIEVLKKVFPSYGVTARPVDLFDGVTATVFALNVKKPFAEWTVLGVFNIDEKNHLDKTISLARAGLNPTETYVVFDFWQNRLVGEFSGELPVHLEPASCKVLSIHRKLAHPQVISTDRHITQGGIELESVEWDAGSSILKGTAKGSPGTDYRLFVYLPVPLKEKGEAHLYHDYPGFTIRTSVTDKSIVGVHVRFDESDTVNWQLDINKHFEA